MGRTRRSGGIGPADEAWALLWELFQDMHGGWSAHVEELGLTEMQAHMLDEIAEHAPSSMRAHADRLHVDPSWVTDLVDQLERRGDVVRRPSPDDRRVKLVELTEQGRRTNEDVHCFMRQAPPGLRALPAERQRELLAIVRAALDVQRALPPAAGA
jgi:DNA-binding MarR family transcriptional regulator